MSRDLAPSKRALWPVSAALLLSGCFFDQLQRSEEDDIRRVEQKQATLQTEQNKSATLQQREEQLEIELSKRQLSLHELNDRVQELNAKNGRALAENDVTRHQYNDSLQNLHETNQQLARATQSTDGSIEERRERIASLKARLRAQLDLLLR